MLLILISDVIESVWILEHVKVINDVELDVTKFPNVNSFFTQSFAIRLICIIILVVAKPNSNLTIVKGCK